MSNKSETRAKEKETATLGTRSAVYEIRVQGHLEHRWAGWLGEMQITLEDDGQTVLTARVVDQAALYGLLRKVRDLGLSLLSVSCVSPGQLEK